MPFFIAAKSQHIRYDDLMSQRQKNQSQHIVLTLPAGPIQRLLLETDGKLIQGISMLFDDELPPPQAATKIPKSLDAIAQQLRDYSQQAHNHWLLDLSDKGTPFQRKVWRYLQTIPMGTTQSYGEVAKALNSSARAVGNACRANPFLLVVPCHRVVKKTGIGGFGGKIDGEAVAIKQGLLAHEK
jgi:methylated-DNA-[protein]-cysteine S-methyltransferase